MKDNITFQQWLKIDDYARAKAMLLWNLRKGDGKIIIQAVLDAFKKQYSKIQGLVIFSTPGILDNCWIINVQHPFIFDNRLIPKKFKGFEVRSYVAPSTLPKEFCIDDPEKEYMWEPERFERFVDRCAAEIRNRLGDPTMSRKDMLDALCFGDFEAHVAFCNKHGKFNDT